MRNRRKNLREELGRGRGREEKRSRGEKMERRG
jgi:hypothetical protein